MSANECGRFFCVARIFCRWFQRRLFAEAIENPERLIVPTLSLYEVFKRVLQQTDENKALQAVATMQQGQVVDLATLALRAAKISIEHRLPMADSEIFATAQAYNATLWTQDDDFEGLDHVQYRKKS